MEVKEKIVVDYNSGEVVEHTADIVKVRRVNSDAFVNVYLDDMSGILNVKSKTDLRILAWMWKFSSFPTDECPGNCVFLCDMLMERIEKDLKISRQTIRNCICNMSKSGILIKDRNHRATYYLNPKYFFKGRVEDLPRVRRVLLKYEIVD